MKIQNEEAVSPGKAVTTEDAVSPVIGVILMVAITVILAAVIAAFVFGLAGTTGSSKNVGITVALNGTDGYEVTLQGGSDLSSLNKLDYSIDGGSFVDTGATSFEVGQIIQIAESNPSGKKLILRGLFNDGSQQVLFDKQF